MIDTITLAAWVEVDGKYAKYYHTTNACILQLPKEDTVLGEASEARHKGIALCPDCEKMNGKP